MKRDAILFLVVFVAAFALFGAVLFRNRSGNQVTQQATPREMRHMMRSE
jgi:hypothetical protein